MLGRLMPKVWVPVMSAGGIALPRCWELTRVALSDAAGGIVASGRIELEEDADAVDAGVAGRAASIPK